MSESVSNAMAMRSVLCLFLLNVLGVPQPITQTLASPLSLPSVNVKKWFGWKTETSTINPPAISTTTKTPFSIVFIPKGFSKKVHNVSEDGTTINSTKGVLTAPNPTKSSKGLKEVVKHLWNKTKNYFSSSETTTQQPRRLVLLVPLDWRVMKGSPCHRGKNQSDHQGCLPSSQLAGFSWWTLALTLMGALLMGVGVWIVFTRRRSLLTPTWNSVKMCSLKPPWPWYSSEPNSHPSPREPALTPPVVKKSPGPPPTCRPPPPLPVPDSATSHRPNSMYHTTPGSPGHIYSTPTLAPPPYPGWASNASDHVHIYEVPPSFPSYDLADLEIDTTTLKAAFSPNQTRR